MRLRGPLLVVALAVALPACGRTTVRAVTPTPGPAPSAGPATTQAGTPATQEGPTAQGGAGSPPALPVVARAATAGLTAMPWQDLQEQGASATVQVTYGGCQGPPVSVTVEQAPTVVRVGVYDRRAPGPICPQYLVTRVYRFAWPAPLAGRATAAVAAGTPGA